MQCSMCQNPLAVYIFFDRYKYDAALRQRHMDLETFELRYLNTYNHTYAQMLLQADQGSHKKYREICGLPELPDLHDLVRSRVPSSTTARESLFSLTVPTTANFRHPHRSQLMAPNFSSTSLNTPGTRGRVTSPNTSAFTSDRLTAPSSVGSYSTVQYPAHSNLTNQSSFHSVEDDEAEVISVSSDSPEEQAARRPTHGRPRNAQKRHPGPRRPAADDPVAYSLCAEEPTTMTKTEEDRCLTCRRNGLTCSGTQLVSGRDEKPRCQVCSTKRSNTEDGTGTRRCYWRNAAAGILTFGDAKRAASLS